jgi:TadE-like protein
MKNRKITYLYQNFDPVTSLNWLLRSTCISGSAIIELAIVIPIIFILGYLCLDYTRIFLAYEAMSSISRESARMASQQCETAVDFNACLNSNNIWTSVQTFANSTLPGAEVIISAYNLTTNTPAIESAGTTGLVLVPGSSPPLYVTPVLQKSSHFNASYFNANINTTKGLLFAILLLSPLGLVSYAWWWERFSILSVQ